MAGGIELEKRRRRPTMVGEGFFQKNWTPMSLKMWVRLAVVHTERHRENKGKDNDWSGKKTTDAKIESFYNNNNVRLEWVREKKVVFSRLYIMNFKHRFIFILHLCTCSCLCLSSSAILREGNVIEMTASVDLDIITIIISRFIERFSSSSSLDDVDEAKRNPIWARVFEFTKFHLFD